TKQFGCHRRDSIDRVPEAVGGAIHSPRRTAPPETRSIESLRIPVRSRYIMDMTVPAALLFCSLHAAIEAMAVHLAACVLAIIAFKLDSGVTNMIFFIEHSAEGLQDG